MKRIIVAAALALAVTLPAAPALAQRDRVFVASYGSDSNPCTFGSPCKTFQQAVNVVAVEGEVTAIDSAGFGPVSIAKSVTITSPNGVEAGIVAASGGNAIAINASSAATITLRGLTLDGSGAGAHGILLTSTGGGTLNIINTIVKNYTEAGIAIEPGGASVFNLTIYNSYFLNNGGDGIKLAPTASGIGFASIDQTTANNNSSNGIELNGSGGGGATGSITRSQANLNTNDGILLNDAVAVVKNCYVSGNGTDGVALTNTAGILLSGSELTFSGSSVDLRNSSSTVFSFGDNVIGDTSGTITQHSLQ